MVLYFTDTLVSTTSPGHKRYLTILGPSLVILLSAIGEGRAPWPSRMRSASGKRSFLRHNASQLSEMSFRTTTASRKILVQLSGLRTPRLTSREREVRTPPGADDASPRLGAVCFGLLESHDGQ